MNSRDAAQARERIVDSQSDLQWFADVLYDPLLGPEIKTTQLESINAQLLQIIDRGDKFTLRELRVVGEQNTPGILEFNFEFQRRTGDADQEAGGKGALDCELDQFVLLLLGGWHE